MKLKILIAIFLQIQNIHGLKSNICDNDLLLKDGLITLKSTPPNIEVEVPKLVKSGELITVKIKGLKDVSGLALQAKSDNESPVGKFSADLTKCDDSAIYEKSLSENVTEISWEAPVIEEAINFRFHVTIIQSSSDDLYPPYITNAITIETADNELDFIYDGCGSQKVCYGIPDGCIISKNCNLFSAVEFVNGNFEYELLSNENQNYVALGVSLSPIMANTSNVECIQATPGVITAYTSWMSPPRVVARANVDQTIIQFVEGKLINGRIYCRVIRDSFSIVNDHIIDLENERYFLLIAGGIQLREDSVGTHGQVNRGATPEAISLIPEQITTLPPSDNSIYDGCGTEKLCFGMADGCISNRNCQLLATVRRANSDFFEIEMLSNPQHSYVAFGLSQTRNMNQASVVECVHISGTISTHASWNYAMENSRENIPQTFVRLREGRVEDGRIYCKIERDTQTEVRGENFHLENQMHYIQLAGGLILFENSVGPHFTFRQISAEKVDLTNPGEVRGASMSVLLLIHGSFMIVAWIGLTSLGVVLAKYFKAMWPRQKMFGKDLWFAWHACLMCLTWILTLIGFILIFVDLGAWRTTTHSILGCIVFCFATLQVIGGMMRPNPKAENRPVFNWMHQAFGNITHLLAILCIFYAIPLAAARLPEYTIYILIGFVSFYFLIHFVFMIFEVKGQIKISKQEKITQQNLKTPYSILKTCLLGIHGIVVVTVVIGLILIFTLDL